MSDGAVMSEAFRRQVVRAVQQFLRAAGLEFEGRVQPRRQRKHTHVGYLTTALSAASDASAAWSALPTATFEIYDYATDGSLSASGEYLTVVSRRDAAIASNTFCEVEFKRGKWQLIDANCAASS